MRNPPWHRDELILALDLYFRKDPGSCSPRDPEIVALSKLLNELPIVDLKPDSDRFRNPNSVYMKLSNFKALEFPGKSLSHGNKLDKIVWDEFSLNPASVGELAAAIKACASVPNQSMGSIEEDEIEFPEGQILFRMHRYRERNGTLANTVKQKSWSIFGCLCCEVCGFDFLQTYGSIGEGYIECHHTKPVSLLFPGEKTRLDDLALVCANCHRMLHRKRPWLGIGDLKSLIHDKGME